MKDRICPGPGHPTASNVLFGSDRDGSFHIFRQSLANHPELLVGGKEQSMLRG